MDWMLPMRPWPDAGFLYSRTPLPVPRGANSA